jgi:hypothetical protein
VNTCYQDSLSTAVNCRGRLWGGCQRRRTSGGRSWGASAGTDFFRSFAERFPVRHVGLGWAGLRDFLWHREDVVLRLGSRHWRSFRKRHQFASSRSSLWSDRGSLWSDRSCLWSGRNNLSIGRSGFWSGRSGFWSGRSSLWSRSSARSRRDDPGGSDSVKGRKVVLGHRCFY